MSRVRSGGRSAAVRAKVLASARDLVLSRGVQNVTIPEIAQHAGVAPTSLYRRWGNVSALLLDMAVNRLADRWPLPDEGSVEADLKTWSACIVRGLNAPEEPSFLRILLTSWDLPPAKRVEALTPRLTQLEEMLQRGTDRGEAVPPVEDVVDHILAPLYMRGLLGLPVDEAYAERAVDRLLQCAATMASLPRS